MWQKLNLKVPCKTCPFRTTQGGLRGLGTDRAEEISESLLRGESFTCHSDLDKQERNRNQCVGSMLILDKLQQPNQIMQVAGRLGMFKVADLRGRDVVFDNFADWVSVQAEFGE